MKPASKAAAILPLLAMLGCGTITPSARDVSRQQRATLQASSAVGGRNYISAKLAGITLDGTYYHLTDSKQTFHLSPGKHRIEFHYPATKDISTKRPRRGSFVADPGADYELQVSYFSNGINERIVRPGESANLLVFSE